MINWVVGIFYTNTSTHAFQDFVKNYNLTDLGFFGSKYTWCNKKIGPARISIRLDRVFGNNLWISSYDNSSVYHLHRRCSDHPPLKVQLMSHNFNRTKIFRFQNFWTHYLETNELVSSVWNNSTNNSIPLTGSHSNLYKAHRVFSNWNRNNLGMLETKLNDVQSKIIDLESRLDNNNHSNSILLHLSSIYNLQMALIK